MTLDSICVAYWSLRDPLCESQVLPVLRGLAVDGYRLGLMTFEQPAWRLGQAEEHQANQELRRQGIRWLPQRYHAWPPTASTAIDILGGALRARWERPRLLHGRGSVPACVAYLASRGTNSLFFNDADGPLSMEYVDAGIWKADSLVPQVVGRAEDVFLDAADANAVLTSTRASQVRRKGRVEPIVLPCAVDMDLFAPNSEAADRIRHDLSLEGTVFVYAGKSGGWYLVEPMMDFVAAYQSLGETTTMLVLTRMSPEPFERAAAARGVTCRVRSASREQMPSYLSAADAGLSFILPAPSKTACSPVKNGEYLACGLPVVTTAAIGDYSNLIASRRVGVVVDSLAHGALEIAARGLRDLLKEGTSLKRRCRDAARDHAGLNEVVLPRYRALYRELLGKGGAHA